MNRFSLRKPLAVLTGLILTGGIFWTGIAPQKAGATPIVADPITFTDLTNDLYGNLMPTTVDILPGAGDGSLLVSVMYDFFGNNDHVFERVTPTGDRSVFASTFHHRRDEIYFVTIRQSIAGWNVGDIYTGNGNPGQIAKISPDGSVVTDPWVDLKDPRLTRGGVTQDRTGLFGYDLIVATANNDHDPSGVYRINSAGVATKITEIPYHVEGLAVIPNNPSFGPLAGKIALGAEHVLGIYTIAPDNTVDFVDLPAFDIEPESLTPVLANHYFAGADFNHNDVTPPYGDLKQHIWTAGADQFTNRIGDLLIAQETPGRLLQLHWNGAAFEAATIGTVGYWEGINMIPTQEPPRQQGEATRTQGFWSTHLAAMTSAVNEDCFNLGAINPDPSLGEIEAMMWGNIAKQDGVDRSELGQARMQLVQQLIAAQANECLLGTTPEDKGFSPTLIEDAVAALNGTDIALMLELANQLDQFNNTGDEVELTGSQASLIGPANPRGARNAALPAGPGINPGPAFL